jgi:hypothetical protein
MQIGVDPSLAGSLAARADGRVIVIGCFRSWQCGTWVGDITVDWRWERPGEAYAEAVPVEGVQLFVDRRVAPVLELADPTLTRARLPFFGGLAVELGRPELWIDWLDRPGSFATVAGHT